MVLREGVKCIMLLKYLPMKLVKFSSLRWSNSYVAILHYPFWAQPLQGEEMGHTDILTTQMRIGVCNNPGHMTSEVHAWRSHD